MFEPNYKTLYSLQTKVLQLFKTINGPFYLTGGTALGRFYLHHRYSADLDFFVNSHPAFKKAIEPYAQLLHTHFTIQKEGSLLTDEFVRYLIEDEHTLLKIEFINDVSYHYGKSIENAIYPVDNVRNILSNKLTCVAGRDEPKDFFDILHIALNYTFNWKEVFNEATEKMLMNEIVLSQRMLEFPVELLLQVEWLIQFPQTEQIKKFQEIISNDILLGGLNSLCNNGLSINNAILNYK
jgi:predicted nucleotidyltransferase component of viral defense system